MYFFQTVTVGNNRLQSLKICDASQEINAIYSADRLEYKGELAIVDEEDECFSG